MVEDTWYEIYSLLELSPKMCQFVRVLGKLADYFICSEAIAVLSLCVYLLVLSGLELYCF